jgi:CRISPR-associated endonuclease/helicase Cas3
MVESIEGCASELQRIAHVRQDEQGKWCEPHLLDHHLQQVSRLASEFSSSFASPEFGEILGESHDLGKTSQEWQDYIRCTSGYDCYSAKSVSRVEHSASGALVIERHLDYPIGRWLAYAVAGHHTGLPDWSGSQAALKYRLENAVSAYKKIHQSYTQHLAKKNFSSFEMPWKFNPNNLDISLWIRMLFSCLVDADYLDTEHYMDPTSSQRRKGYESIETLLDRFNNHMNTFIDGAVGNQILEVYNLRQQILRDCRNAARSRPGLFTLTVPTGGGKTLSSLAFALEHARIHGKSRIIYVIPYTSIIEQTAHVFKEVLGIDQVIEHHSNLVDDCNDPRSRLAMENWDAPIIVTTNVQFFESLFSAKPGRCRKLHNIVNSVIIFDEAQIIEPGVIKPVLNSLELVCNHYHATMVFCTATQPAFTKTEKFPKFPGFEKTKIIEIISNVQLLYKKLKRVEIDCTQAFEKISWSYLAEELINFEKVLCIVSDRKSCRELFRLMPLGTYHLSALMCPEHRSEVIRRIKTELSGAGFVRVISTQLVEAGVDIDFPVVYRAMAGLDSIAQAAGRCNREGKLNGVGKFGYCKLFMPEKIPPSGLLRKAMEITIELLSQDLHRDINLADTSIFTEYFSRLYWSVNSLDDKNVCTRLVPSLPDFGIQFRSVAEDFRIIENNEMVQIIVRYGDGSRLADELKMRIAAKLIVSRELLRKLQRYTVSVYKQQFDVMWERGSLEEVLSGLYLLKCEVEYDRSCGLLVDELPSDPIMYMS